MTSRAGKAEHEYRLLGLVALGGVFLVLMQFDLGLWAGLPALLGALGLFFPGTVGIPFTLTLILGLVVFQPALTGFPTWMQPRSTLLEDLLLALAVLAYVIAHGRVLALRHHAVPPDTRRHRRPDHERFAGRWLLPGEPTRRSASAVPPREIGGVLLAIPTFVFLAYLLWLRLSLEPPPEWLDLPVPVWRAFVVLWSAMLCLAGVYTLTSYLGRAFASRAESLMFLQDQAWAQTRGEQRQMHSWRVWGRLARERKEQP
jgi:hypothetical protein